MSLAAPPTLVRSVRPDEFDEVGRVTYLGFGHGEPGARQPDPERLALLHDIAGRAAGGDVLVAAEPESGRILGTASLLRAGGPLTRQSRDGEAEVRLLAVLPEARRQGLGQALMTAAAERARGWGAPALILDTGPDNQRSQRLYRRLGYERLPERETIPAGSGGFLAVFRLDLSSPVGA